MSGLKTPILVALHFVSFCGLVDYGEGCIGIRTKHPFDGTRLEGQWWEYQSFNTVNLTDPSTYDCLVANFYPRLVSGVLIMTIIEDFIKRVPGTPNTDHTRNEWTVKAESDKTTSKFVGKIQNAASGFSQDYSYAVVDTDYDNWLLMTFCTDQRPSFWGVKFMTRSNELAGAQEAHFEKMLREILNENITTDHYRWTRKTYTIKNNAGCKPVVFPDTLTNFIYFDDYIIR